MLSVPSNTSGDDGKFVHPAAKIAPSTQVRRTKWRITDWCIIHESVSSKKKLTILLWGYRLWAFAPPTDQVFAYDLVMGALSDEVGHPSPWEARPMLENGDYITLKGDLISLLQIAYLCYCGQDRLGCSRHAYQGHYSGSGGSEEMWRSIMIRPIE